MNKCAWRFGDLVLTGERQVTLKEGFPRTAFFFTIARLWNVLGLNPVLLSDGQATKRLYHATTTNLSAECYAFCPYPIMETECSSETSLYICNTRQLPNYDNSDYHENFSRAYTLLQDAPKIEFATGVQNVSVNAKWVLRHAV